MPMLFWPAPEIPVRAVIAEATEELAAEGAARFGFASSTGDWRRTVVPRGLPPMASASPGLNALPPGHPQGYQDCFHAFVGDVYAAVTTGAPAGLPAFADGLRAARITQSLLDSAARDGWVDVALPGTGQDQLDLPSSAGSNGSAVEQDARVSPPTGAAARSGAAQPR